MSKISAVILDPYTSTMSRGPTVSVPVRKIRPRPSGVVHRARTALVRATACACRRVLAWLQAATSLAHDVCERVENADGDRAWNKELYDEIANAYERLVREPSAFLDEHRGKWMMMTTAGDVYVYANLDEMWRGGVKGVLHIVGDRIDRDERALLS